MSKENESEVDEVEEVTRCICGNIEPLVDDEFEDNGLFVQCDKCLVWQHAYCVGLLSDKQMPEMYHCELCRPDLHKIIYRPRKPKTSRYQGVESQAASSKELQTSVLLPEEVSDEMETGPRKRRSTMNSRDAAYDRQLEAALLLSTQQDQTTHIPAPSLSGRSVRSTRRQSPPATKRERTPSPSPPREEPKQKRRKKGSAPDKEETTSIDLPASRRRGGKRKLASVSGAMSPASEVEASQVSVDDLPRPKSAASHMPAPNLPPSQPGSRAASRESTPVHSVASRKRGTRGHKKSNAPTHLSRGNTTMSTVSTVALPSTPSGKLHAMSEMRKRVSAILEYVGRAQEEMTQEMTEWSAFVPEVTFQLVDNKKRKEDTVWGYGYSEGGSVELIEELTSSLLRWESQYG